MTIHPPNPLGVVEAAQRMADKAGEKEAPVFQKVALCSMIVMAASSATQLMLQVIRELRKHDDHEKQHTR